MNNVSVRDLYKTISKTKTHLVQSKEIATTCVCPYLFKMSYPFGVPGGERDYFVANTVHDIMSLALPTTVLDNWKRGTNKQEFENIARTIDKDSESIVENVIANAKEKITTDGKASPPEDFEFEVIDRYYGLLFGIAKRIMKDHEQPKRAITEVTISNVNQLHEGRIDAIIEFTDGQYGVIDWKTNDINQASSSGTDKWQLISNILLANFRYTGSEDNWSRFRFGSVVYYLNAYVPNLPIQQHWLNKIKDDRKFAYETLCGGRPHAQKPPFCPICDKESESSSDCQFYRKDSRLANEGNLPSDYAKIRGQLIKRRYLVLDERAETHKHKFVIQTMINNLGEMTALEELEKSGIIHCGYRLHSMNNNSIIFMGCNNNDEDDVITFLETRKVVRIIGKEEDMPFLGCVNEKGFVKVVEGSKLVIDLDGKISAQRAQQQLYNLPIIIMPDEINLTRRVLEPMHRFHRLAADIMLPQELFENDSIS